VVTSTSVPFSIAETGTAGPTAVAGSLSPGLVIDSTIVAKFGGTGGYIVGAAFTVSGHTGGYFAGLQGRGCANAALGAVTPAHTTTQCWYNGPRWFSGANESTPDPIGGTPANGLNLFTTPWDPTAHYNNAGKLTGVDVISHPDAYGVFQGTTWRDMDFYLGVYITNADYKVYWGTAGHVDSVIDVTHDEPVPFSANIGSSWGILNSNASAANIAGSFDQRAELSGSDFGCVPPLLTFAATARPTCAAAAIQQFTQTAVPGPIVYTNGAATNVRTSSAPNNVLSASNGFGMYLKGRAFTFELTGGALPAAGTVWTMRDYTGAYYGGNGAAPPDGGGAEGIYQYIPPPLRVLNAPGASVQFSYNVTNTLVPVTGTILSNVHTVPDPYYVTSAYDIAVNAKDIQFVNVPTGATIRIYSSSGVLLRVLQNTTTQLGGIVHWDVRNRTNQFVSSGVYFYTVEAGGLSHSGRMTIVQYASTVQ
jgi:hypothetical protein